MKPLDQLGLAIKHMIAKKITTREKLFVIIKIWSTFHTKERSLDNVRYQLKDLGLDYADAAFIHCPTAVEPEKYMIAGQKSECDIV